MSNKRKSRKNRLKEAEAENMVTVVLGAFILGVVALFTGIALLIPPILPVLFVSLFFFMLFKD